MAQEARRSSGKWLLIGGFLLVVSAVAVAALLPFVDCPACTGTGSLALSLKNAKRDYQGATSINCPGCTGGKLTVFGFLGLPPIETLLPADLKPVR